MDKTQNYKYFQQKIKNPDLLDLIIYFRSANSITVDFIVRF